MEKLTLHALLTTAAKRPQGMADPTYSPIKVRFLFQTPSFGLSNRLYPAFKPHFWRPALHVVSETKISCTQALRLVSEYAVFEHSSMKSSKRGDLTNIFGGIS